MIHESLKDHIASALQELGVENPDVELEHPAELEHGDFATNAAMKYGKQLGKNPQEFAEEIVEKIRQSLDGPSTSSGEARDRSSNLERIEIAAPGFINFHLARDFLAKSIKDIDVHDTAFGANERLGGKQVMVEYTDPNPFKEMHAGHVMSNAIGEAMARLYEWNGASVIRTCYPGDVGLHVAKAIWAIIHVLGEEQIEQKQTLDENVKFLGKAYATAESRLMHNAQGIGEAAYSEQDLAGHVSGGPSKEDIQAQINEINRKVYEICAGNADDADPDIPKIKKIYDWGREVSLKRFEVIFEKLGTSFDQYYFESEVFERGRELVKDGLAQGVFEESDGAIVFRGEPFDLHTRVFINSGGLPTYEAKDLGLAFTKFEQYSLDESVVVTADEQKSYFQVLLKALEQMNEVYAEKSLHITHGMLQTPEGKMSSRKGNVLGGGTVIEDAEERAREKIKESDRDLEDPDKLATEEGVAAVKYAILKQTPGKNVVFDLDQALSLEGDSGPYLQYTHTRCVSVLAQGKELGLTPDASIPPSEPYELERLLYRFPEVVASAFEDKAPQQLVSYLTDIAGRFNTFYGQERIADADDEHAPYKLALTEAVRVVLRNGLSILGISAPERM